MGGRVNIQPLFSDYIPSHHIISNYFFMSRKMIWKGEIIWEKHNNYIVSTLPGALGRVRATPI